MDPSTFMTGSGAGGPPPSSLSGQDQAIPAGIPPELLQWHQQQQQPQQHAASQQNSSAASGGPQPGFAGAQPSSSKNTLDDLGAQAQQQSSTGPIRPKVTGADEGASGTAPVPAQKSAKAPAPKSAPVRAACLFCRTRKSRCNGKQPCHNCINRGKEDDCIYTVSRRGGKPKPKPNQSQEEANLEQHLKRLFTLSQLPQQVRVPGAIPQLFDAQREHQSPNSYQYQQMQSPNLDFHNQQQSHSPNFFAGSSGQQQPTQPSAPVPTSQAAEVPQGQTPAWDPMAVLYNALNQPFGQSGSFAPPSSGASPAPPVMSQQLSQPPFQQAFQQAPPQQPWQVSPQLGQPQQDSNATPPLPVQHQPQHTNVPAPTLVPHGETDVYSILQGYYTSLYRFIPVFVPPQYIHEMASRLGLDSPFVLALQAILPLLQSGDSEQDGNSSAQGFAAGLSIGPGNSGLIFPSSERRRQVLEITSYYERRASEAIEAVLERAEGQLQGGSKEEASAQDSTLGVIQALAVLCVYHYGSGRALKARLKADQALGLAMAKGLHRLKRSPTDGADATAKSSFVSTADPLGGQSLFSELSEDVTYEMRKRLWWTCWSSSLWCSYNTAIVPTIRADDPRVRTEMPVAADQSLWAANIKSLQSLLLIQERVLALANLKNDDGDGSMKKDSAAQSAYGGSSHGGETPGAVDAPAFASLPPNATRQDVLDSMLDIDKSLQEQIQVIEQDELGFKQLCEQSSSRAGPENLARIDEDLALYLRRSAAIQVYTSSLTLHLGQAFQGASLFERKLCFLNTVNESDASAACQVPMPDSFSSVFADKSPASKKGSSEGGAEAQWKEWMDKNPSRASPQDLFARGPFLPKDSLSRCVHASKRLLEIARSKHKEPNPFNACSYVLISFTLLMQALAVSSGSQDGEGDDAAQDDQYADGDGDGEMYDFANGGDFDMDQFLKGGDDEASTFAGSGDWAMSDAATQSGGEASRDGTSLADNPEFQAFSRGLLQSAQGAAALGNFNGVGSLGSGGPEGPSNSQSQSHPAWLSQSAASAENPTGAGTFAPGLDMLPDTTTTTTTTHFTDDEAARQRRAKLREIWSRVREAHATLKDLSKYWRMVEPMADEVSLCLETSQLLLQR